MQVLNHFNTDYEPRKQETDQQIATWVAESKTDGVVNISSLPSNVFIAVYERVWVDQAAADAYYQFGIYLSEKYECPIESFEIVDNV
jgi:hypothetical protein